MHAIGVYEDKGRSGPSADGRNKRDVRVVTRGSGRPIVLVLASYEPVNWILTNGGANVSAVRLSGYHPSIVAGAGTAPVLRIGSAYAYSAGGADYQNLRQAVARYTGSPEIHSFQGSYAGSEFQVSGR